jgi:hypothetical protein
MVLLDALPGARTPGEQIALSELGRMYAARPGEQIGQVVYVLAAGLRAVVPPGELGDHLVSQPVVAIP